MNIQSGNQGIFCIKYESFEGSQKDMGPHVYVIQRRKIDKIRGSESGKLLYLRSKDANSHFEYYFSLKSLEAVQFKLDQPEYLDISSTMFAYRGRPLPEIKPRTRERVLGCFFQIDDHYNGRVVSRVMKEIYTEIFPELEGNINSPWIYRKILSRAEAEKILQSLFEAFHNTPVGIRELLS